MGLSSSWFRLFCLLALILEMGCGGEPPSAPAQSGPGGPPGAKGPPPPVPVTVVTAEAISWEDTLSLGATLAPWQQATLAVEVDGRVLSAAADLGDLVRKGAPLLEISPDEMKLALARAEADFADAHASWERTRRLHASGNATESEMDAARSRAATTEAASSLARKKLADATLRAPWEGRVARRHLDPGDYARVGTPAFELAMTSPLRLKVEIPEAWQGKVTVGTTVWTSVGGSAEDLKGEVTRVSPLVDPGSRTFAVEARIPNEDGKILAGSFARVRLSMGKREDAVALPPSALASSAGVDRVFHVEGNVARESRVTLLHRSPDRLVVTGVPVGAQVVVKGVYQLQEGSPVTLDSAKTSPGKPSRPPTPPPGAQRP